MPVISKRQTISILQNKFMVETEKEGLTDVIFI